MGGGCMTAMEALDMGGAKNKCEAIRVQDSGGIAAGSTALGFATNKKYQYNLNVGFRSGPFYSMVPSSSSTAVEHFRYDYGYGAFNPTGLGFGNPHDFDKRKTQYQQHISGGVMRCALGNQDPRPQMAGQQLIKCHDKFNLLFFLPKKKEIQSTSCVSLPHALCGSASPPCASPQG
ncbi:uncharacterized protein LOC120644606 [Panicum virgatum]|uniref:uncharacterized protein LOC120644606 n=1 Tax=Panicum virgatum TaxID=38727 RepID=UPI0019D5E662|nr:uncharacterized protein LOC120644606 [Panicum virgatum]